MPLTIAEFQNLIRDRYFATDNARGTHATFLLLTEEFGELATALYNCNKQAHGGSRQWQDATAGDAVGCP